MKTKTIVLSLSAIAALAAGGVLASKYLNIKLPKVKYSFKKGDKEEDKIIWLDTPYVEKLE